MKGLIDAGGNASGGANQHGTALQLVFGSKVNIDADVPRWSWLATTMKVARPSYGLAGRVSGASMHLAGTSQQLRGTCWSGLSGTVTRRPGMPQVSVGR